MATRASVTACRWLRSASHRGATATDVAITELQHLRSAQSAHCPVPDGSVRRGNVPRIHARHSAVTFVPEDHPIGAPDFEALNDGPVGSVWTFSRQHYRLRVSTSPGTTPTHSRACRTGPMIRRGFSRTGSWCSRQVPTDLFCPSRRWDTGVFRPSQHGVSSGAASEDVNGNQSPAASDSLQVVKSSGRTPRHRSRNLTPPGYAGGWSCSG